MKDLLQQEGVRVGESDAGSQSGGKYGLVGESDADWSGDVNDRKSTTGYYFNLNGRGAALSWGVKKQATVALSSSEAEYQGMAAAVQEALYLKQLLEDFGIQQKRPIAIGEDNQSCIRLCQNPVMHKRSKHIETKFHFIRDKHGGWDYFNSLRPHRQNGSGHLHKVLTRFESGNIQSSFDGKRLYAISSSLSGSVRKSIKL